MTANKHVGEPICLVLQVTPKEGMNSALHALEDDWKVLFQVHWCLNVPGFCACVSASISVLGQFLFTPQEMTQEPDLGLVQAQWRVSLPAPKQRKEMAIFEQGEIPGEEGGCLSSPQRSPTTHFGDKKDFRHPSSLASREHRQAAEQ